MANKTIALKLPSYSGTNGLTLIITAPANGTIANGSGDALEPGANGLFTAVVTENVSGWFDAAVLNGATVIAEGGKLLIPSDTAGTYIVDDPNVSTAPTVSQIVDGIEAFIVGNGPRPITVTVTNGTTPLEGAFVTLSKPGTTHTWRTNVNGLVTFSLTDATWNVAIACDGHSFAVTTLVVNASTANPTYTMTAIAITPSPAGTVTGYYTAFSESGVPEAGVSVSCSLVKWPHGAAGKAGDSTQRVSTSNGSGIVEFTGMFPGATYEFSRGGGEPFRVMIPANATGAIALNSIIGSP